MANPTTLLWHDYETTGADPRRDRPLQFACLRTSVDLEPLGPTQVYWCQPPVDALVSPRATLTTGLAPDDCAARGDTEARFADQVHEVLAEPGTCAVGYNSLRFDDEVTRHLLYRNFHDPYAREWRNDNSRWDLIDLARMAAALRPDGIAWPVVDGRTSFRLQDLAAANRLIAEAAHDAASDVHTTLALGRLLRDRQRRLWDWYWTLRRKQAVQPLLDWRLRAPVLHVSSRYPAARRHVAIIAPLAVHPERPNEIIVCDLVEPVDELLALDADEIADRVFTARADLPEDVTRIALRTVHINRCPALAPLATLRADDARRLGIDVEACLERASRIAVDTGLADKVRSVYARAGALPTAPDVDAALYAGFLPDADRGLLEAMRTSPPQRLATIGERFGDRRYRELAFRFRARNFPQSLDVDEVERWHAHCHKRLIDGDAGAGAAWRSWRAELAACRSERTGDGPALALLDRLEAWTLRCLAQAGGSPPDAPSA
jgi:exodeoxyribonuclease-1